MDNNLVIWGVRSYKGDKWQRKKIAFKKVTGRNILDSIETKHLSISQTNAMIKHTETTKTTKNDDYLFQNVRS